MVFVGRSATHETRENARAFGGTCRKVVGCGPRGQSFFHEEHAVIVGGPIVHGLDQLQSGRGEFFDDYFLWYPMAATVRRDSFDRVESGAGWEVDDGQLAAGLQRAYQGGVELGWLGQMVVDAAQKDRIAAFRGEIRVCFFALDNDYIGEVPLRHIRSEASKFLLVNFGGEDFSGAAYQLRCDKSVAAVARADVGHDGFRFP